MTADVFDFDLGDRHCAVCGVLMLPFELRSGEIAYRCPACGQHAI